MNVVISGVSGLIGSALVPKLRESNHSVTRLVRRTAANDHDIIPWNPLRGTLDRDALIGCGALVHLAGANLAGERWTASRRRLLYDSRVNSARLLAENISNLTEPPSVVISASAIGIYGDRGDELLTESSPPGRGFLADLCRDWEAAWQPAVDKGVRVVYLRTGIVLARHGGALKKMLPVFRLGLGGRVGSGKQFYSWIALNDLIRIIEAAVTDTRLRGPVNAVSPGPVTNIEFTKSLARTLKRPACLPVPAFALKLMFGQMANETLLASTRVEPAKLKTLGFSFQSPDLDSALRKSI